MKYTFTIGIIIALFTGSAGVAVADDAIRHPVDCYTIPKAKCHGCPKDSVLVGRMTFDPLPEYMKPSKLTVEYYCDVDEDSDIIFRVKNYNKSFVLSEYEKNYPGPIHVGDTISAEFTITPVGCCGVIRPEFVAIQPKTYYYEDTTMHVEIPRARLVAPFILGIDGITKAMNSPVLKVASSPFGFLPEVWGDSVFFNASPKLPEKYLEEHALERRKKLNFFAVKTVVYTKLDDFGYRHIKCNLTPYFHHDAGIALSIHASEDIKIKNMSSSYLKPVNPEDTIEFSFDLKITEPGISYIFIYFRTINSTYGKPLVAWGSKSVLENKQNIHFGHDENMTLLFCNANGPRREIFGTTARSGEWVPSPKLPYLQANEPRISWLENLPSKLRFKPWRKYVSRGYDKVMSFDSPEP